MIGEIWKTAVYHGELYEGLYKVSNLGRILSLNYRNTGKAELMTPVDNGDGYFQVGLSKNGGYKMCYVHRLVAEAFLDNPEGKPQVNHKIEGEKGKKINMVIFNEDGTIDKKRTTIEWVTPKENSNHGTRNERIFEKTTNGKCSKKVLQFSKSGEFIREWPSIHECGRNGFDSSSVCKCCNGKLPHYKGFLWMYK